MGGTFYIKRLNSGSGGCSKLDSRSFGMLVCTGDTDAFTLDDSDMDSFPPLVEVEHAPMLDTRIAVNYFENKLMPPSAHMLYVCLRCAEADVSKYRLRIAPQVARQDQMVDAPEKGEDDPVKAEFLENHSDMDKFLQGKFEVLELEPFTLKFDKTRKTPEVTDSGSEENKDHGLFYIRLLLLVGDDPRAEKMEFRDTEIIDLTDDSPTGFPASLKIWISSRKGSSSSRVMRKPTEKNLLLVETLPDDAIEDNSGRDILEALGQMDDEDYEKVED